MTLHEQRRRKIAIGRVRELIQGYYRQAVEEADSIDPEEVSEWAREHGVLQPMMEDMMGCRTKADRQQLAATYWARCQFLLNDVVTDEEV